MFLHNTAIYEARTRDDVNERKQNIRAARFQHRSMTTRDDAAPWGHVRDGRGFQASAVQFTVKYFFKYFFAGREQYFGCAP